MSTLGWIHFTFGCRGHADQAKLSFLITVHKLHEPVKQVAGIFRLDGRQSSLRFDQVSFMRTGERCLLSFMITASACPSGMI